MIDRVLVTLDGSELSEAVLEPARDLCDSTDAHITLLRVAQVPNGGDVNGGYGNASDAAGTVATQTRETVDQKIVRIEDEVQTYLQSKAQTLGGLGERVETEVLFSDKVAESIVEYAKGMEADIILMSTHGRTGLRSIMPGSIAQKVLKESHKPVMMVCPEGAS